jgi:superfamily I DNA and/or RNA helicase/very-short-patch-repair endonuclease
MNKEIEQLELKNNVLQSLRRVGKYYFEIFKKLSSTKLSERDNLIKSKSKKNLVDLGTIFTDKNPLFDLKEEKIIIKIPQNIVPTESQDYSENESKIIPEEYIERLELYELYERMQQYLEVGKKQVYLCYPFIVFSKNEKERYYTPIWLVEVKLNHIPEKNCIEIERMGETEFNHYTLSKFLDKLIEKSNIIYKANEVDLFSLTKTDINDILDIIENIFNIDPLLLKMEDPKNKDLLNLEKIDESKINNLQNNTLYLANNLVVCLLNKQDYHLEKVLKSLSELENDNKDFRDSALYHLFTVEEAYEDQERENQGYHEFYDLVLPANEEQKMVIKLALKNKIVSVEGPPGTGKSHTITNLALYLLKQNKSILITSYKEEALKVLIDFFEKLKIHNYLYMSWLKGDKKSKDEIIRKLDNINYQFPREEKEIDLFISIKEELEKQITNYIEKQKKFGYLYEKVYRDHGFVNEDLEEFINEIQIDNIVKIKNTFLKEIENLNLKKEIDQQIENIIGRLKELMVVNNLDFKDFISYVDLFVKLKKENFFGENIIDDIKFFVKSLIFFKNNKTNGNNQDQSGLKSDEIKKFVADINFLKEKMISARWLFFELKNLNFFYDIFEKIIKFQKHEDELVLFQRLMSGINQILHNLIQESSFNNINFFKDTLQKLEINQFNFEAIENIKKIFEDLNNSSIELKKKLLPPNFIKSIHFRLLKIINRGEDPLKKDLVKFFHQNKNLVKILKITDTEKLLNDKNYKKDVILEINDFLRKMHQLKQTNFLNFIYELHCKIKNYEDEGFISKETVSSAFYKTVISIKEEINKNILSTENIQDVFKTLLVLENIIKILVSKNENLAIKNLFEIYDEDFIFEDFKGDFSFINKLETILKIGENNFSLKVLDLKEYENIYRISSFITEKNIINTEKFFESILIKKVLENVKIQENIDELQNKLKEVKEELRKISKNNLSNQINEYINKALRRREIRLLAKKLKEILKKKKVKRIEEIKNQPDFLRILEIFKIWIIKLEDVFRIFPFKPAFFDYVIVDETSQLLPIYIPPLAYIGKKLIVIGDDKQLRSPELLFFKEEEGDLLFSQTDLNKDKMGEYFKITRKSSSLGLINTLFGNSIQLREHFRCLPEIIKFSNGKFYNNSLKIMTDGMERIGDAFKFIKVEGGKEENTSSINTEGDVLEENKINKREAEELVNYLASLLKDPNYQRFSFGAMSLFRPQADYIYYLFRKKKDEDLGLRKICDEKERKNEPVIIGTADEFQGKERDIILYSFRYAQNSKPSTLNTILRKDNFGHNRLNVALTRARKKMIFFLSVDVVQFPENILKDFLLYAKGDTSSEIIKEEFDSDFEKDVYERMKERGYKLSPQYPACGYRIDLALFRDNLRIGIECDGWQHYDKYGNLNIDDIERQEVLERAGWKILRIPSTKYWKNPDACIDELIEEIKRVVEEYKKYVKEGPHNEKNILEKDVENKGPVPEEIKNNSFILSSSIKTSIESLPDSVNLFRDHRLWFKLAKWAKDNKKLSPLDRIFAYKLGSLIRKKFVPSDKQKNYAKKVLKTAIKYGFDIQNEKENL